MKGEGLKEEWELVKLFSNRVGFVYYLDFSYLSERGGKWMRGKRERKEEMKGVGLRDEWEILNYPRIERIGLTCY